MSALAKKFGRRYPWKKWFAKRRFTLIRGIDFAGRVDTMAVQVRNSAVRLRYHASVRILDGGVLLVSVRPMTLRPRKPTTRPPTAAKAKGTR
jgi:hypothetical protein